MAKNYALNRIARLLRENRERLSKRPTAQIKDWLIQDRHRAAAMSNANRPQR